MTLPAESVHFRYFDMPSLGFRTGHERRAALFSTDLARESALLADRTGHDREHDIPVSATPYNNTLDDIYSQLKLFQPARNSTIPGLRNLEACFDKLRTRLLLRISGNARAVHQVPRIRSAKS